MNLSISKNELCSYYARQLNNFFPDSSNILPEDINKIVDVALDKLNYCFKHVAFSRYFANDQTIYNHLYSDHNIVFTWFLANAAYKISENAILSSKLYYLNKVLHAFDCMYNTDLPDIFLVFHGAGTVLGKAVYDNYFVALHGCTIGSHKGKYPVIGKGVALTAHSAIIGDCTIGNNVSVSIYTSVFQKNIPDNTSVFMNRENGKIEMQTSSEPYAQQFFNVNLNSI